MPSGVMERDGGRKKGTGRNGEVEKAQKKAEKEETIGEEGQGPKETFTKT